MELPIIAEPAIGKRMAFHFDEYTTTPLAMNWRIKISGSKGIKTLSFEFSFSRNP
jgi:hypothetical protein